MTPNLLLQEARLVTSDNRFQDLMRDYRKLVLQNHKWSKYLRVGVSLQGNEALINIFTVENPPHHPLPLGLSEVAPNATIYETLVLQIRVGSNGSLCIPNVRIHQEQRFAHLIHFLTFASSRIHNGHLIPFFPPDEEMNLVSVYPDRDLLLK